MSSNYQRSRAHTESVRENVPADLRPLFDHLIHLADNSHEHGHTTQAGIELRKARRLTGKSEFYRVPSASTHPRRNPPRVTTERVRLDRGGYDRSGRYWGTGEKLYLVTDNENNRFVYVRAASVSEAKAKAYSGTSPYSWRSTF